MTEDLCRVTRYEGIWRIFPRRLLSNDGSLNAGMGARFSSKFQVQEATYKAAQESRGLVVPALPAWCRKIEEPE